MVSTQNITDKYQYAMVFVHQKVQNVRWSLYSPTQQPNKLKSIRIKEDLRINQEEENNKGTVLDTLSEASERICSLKNYQMQAFILQETSKFQNNCAEFRIHYDTIIIVQI